MNRRHEFYTSIQVTTLQPYVILCGPSRNIQSSYFIIDKIIHKCDSPIIAVDLCFKAFFALHLDYSIGCPHVWSFFHKCFYEIRGFKNLTGKNKFLALSISVNNIKE